MVAGLPCLRESDVAFRACLQDVAPGVSEGSSGGSTGRRWSRRSEICTGKRANAVGSRVALLWALTVSDLARTAVAQRVKPRADHQEVAMYDRKLAVVGFGTRSRPPVLRVCLASEVRARYRVAVRSAEGLSLRLRTVGRIQRGLAVRFLRWIRPRAGAKHLRRRAVERKREDGTIVSTVRLKLRLSNIAVAAVSILLLATLLGYVFLENFTHR